MASGTRPGRGATLGRRRGGDLHLAAAQPRHWMRKPLHQRFVVRGDDHGGADLVQLLEEIEQAHRHAVVEVAGRLVGEQQAGPSDHRPGYGDARSEEHTSELQSLMRISYAVFCLKKKNTTNEHK